MYYSQTYGYASKIDEGRIFKNCEDVKVHDLARALDVLKLDALPKYDSAQHLAIKFLRDYIDDLSYETATSRDDEKDAA